MTQCNSRVDTAKSCYIPSGLWHITSVGALGAASTSRTQTLSITSVIVLMYTMFVVDLQVAFWYDGRVKRGVLVSSTEASSLQGFQLFYEELPQVKRVTRVRRARTSN